MGKYSLANFGELDSENLDEYYDAELTINGKLVEIDLSFDEHSITMGQLEKINGWLSDIPKLNKLGIKTINEDFISGYIVKEYIEHHLEELNSEDLDILIQQAKEGKTKEEKVLESIVLKRIGFYPHTSERFINLDYTLRNDLTDYLIVLDFTEDGNLHYITVES